MLISIKVYFGDDMEDEPYLRLIAPFETEITSPDVMEKFRGRID
jgi:hypothetical protein